MAEKTSAAKPKRGRSPSYPGVDLRRALDPSLGPSTTRLGSIQRNRSWPFRCGA